MSSAGEAGARPRQPFLERIGLGRPELRAWALYDWANSALWTTVVSAVFPIYYAKVAAVDLEPAVADARFARATTVCLLLAAVISPLLGAMADYSAARKRWLAGFMLVGVAATASMFLIGRGEWLLGVILFAIANLGAVGSMVFYDSLLPHIAREDELDRVSSAGFALGYLGGGILLALNLAWIQHPEWFGLPHGPGLTSEQQTLPTRISFLSVAAWWLLFSIPLFRRVREPARVIERDERKGAAPLMVAFTRIGETARELKRFRHALVFMLAFFAYSDGIGTIIRMSALLGTRVGIDTGALIVAFLMVQLIGVPFAFLFGALAGRFGAKRAILFAVVVYLIVTLIAWRMHTTAEFYAVAFLVGMVQGGSQALSRSLFASLVPKHKSAEFFGLFSALEKFSGILGPLTYGLVLELTGSTSAAVISIAPFFLVGAVLLVFVDIGAGQRAAREAEREAAGASA